MYRIKKDNGDMIDSYIDKKWKYRTSYIGINKGLYQFHHRYKLFSKIRVICEKKGLDDKHSVVVGGVDINMDNAAAKQIYEKLESNRLNNIKINKDNKIKRKIRTL